MQVAVEVRKEPKPRADRAIDVGAGRSLPAPDHSTCVAVLDILIDQRVARETAPGFQVSAKACFAACDGHKIAGNTSTQCSDKLREQARCERLSPNIQVNVGLLRKATLFYCAFIQLSDPVTLTDRSEM